MNDNQLVIIAIPIYTLQLDAKEHASLQQCFKLLSHYPKCFVKPQSLEIETLIRCYPVEHIISFPDSYFQGIAGYNKLMMSPLFYEAFSPWKYLLIYQTDAWVFSDQLSEWCHRDYDYIGAPWIPKPKYERFYYRLFNSLKRICNRLMGTTDYSRLYYQIGNGGLSLRRTQLFAHIAQEMNDVIEQYLAHPETTMCNEDVFWGIEVNRQKKQLRIPTWKEALHFSFDKNPDICYRLNNNRLPFGCHGWSKHRMLPFWEQHISHWK